MFLRFLSHEIRTPLNIISVGLTLAQMELRAMAGATEDVLSALDGAMGALHVAEGVDRPLVACCSPSLLTHAVLLFLSLSETLSTVQHYDKLSSRLMTLDKVPVRCSTLLDSTLLLFESVAAKKGVSISLAPSDCGDALVEADEPKLVVVLRNLLSNALKFTPEGGSVAVSKRVVDDEGALAMLEDSLQLLHHHPSQQRSGLLLRLRRRVAVQSEASAAASGRIGRRRWCCADPIGRAVRSLSRYEDAAASAGFLLVEMADTGVGMAPESCARLFREVVQFDVNKNQGGNGSGMGRRPLLNRLLSCSFLALFAYCWVESCPMLTAPS